MELTARYVKEKILTDLTRKMVFVGGPRQVGKTTLAENIAEHLGLPHLILNWDDDQDREKILKQEFSINRGLLIFDELHKNRRWRNYLKGLYDKRKRDFQILVTGSARLDLYRFGGDSLQGRYFYHRLHPLSVKELRITAADDLLKLLQYSGFPEPYFQQDLIEKKRWANTYRTRLIKEDLRDLESVTELSAIETLALRLPALVGSPLSLNSIREDLQVAHASVQKWLFVFEKLYYIFKVLPFGAPNIKAVKKQYKHYHYDWTLGESEGARFENFIASHLLKWCHYQEDSFGRLLELKYYRDSEKREVDFVLTEDSKPILFLEVKLSDRNTTDGLVYLKRKYPSVRAAQVVLKTSERTFDKHGIEVLDALSFLSELV